MANRIDPANVSQQPLYGWANQCAMLEKGIDTFQFAGWAKLDTTARNEFDIVLPSHQKRKADKTFLVPNGATIYRIALRLPRALRQDEDKKYGLLEKKATIIGTAGENLKVASTTAAHTATAPAIVCGGDGLYVPNSSAVLAVNEWQALTGQLATLTADTTFKLYVSNAGNTGAGTGIRVSSGEAFVLCEICYKMAAEALDFERTGYPYAPEAMMAKS